MIPHSYHGAGSRAATRVGAADGGDDVEGGPRNPVVQGRGFASDDVASSLHEPRRASQVSGALAQSMILKVGWITVA